MIVRRVSSYILMTRRLTSDIGLTASSKHLARSLPGPRTMFSCQGKEAL